MISYHKNGKALNYDLNIYNRRSDTYHFLEQEKGCKDIFTPLISDLYYL